MAVLDAVHFIPTDAAVADEGARIRRSRHLKLPDAIQATVATRHTP